MLDRFSETYDAHFPDVYRFLRRLGVLAGDAEDLCHEVFLVFHKKMAAVLPEVTDRAFLFGVAARVAADYRRLKRHRSVPLDASHPAAEGHPETVYAMRRDLERALDRLSLERRAVLVMHELEGLTAPEIASSLGVPLNTVYSRLRLAREDFGRALVETGYTDA